jgi:hypothetical protein
MREKITKETLEKYGFKKDKGKDIWRLDDENNGEYVSVLGFEDKYGFLWVCLADKFRRNNDFNPLLDNDTAHTRVSFIEDIQYVMRLVHMQHLHIFEEPEFSPS